MALAGRCRHAGTFRVGWAKTAERVNNSQLAGPMDPSRIEQRRPGPSTVFLRATLLWGDFVAIRDELAPGQSVRLTSPGPWSALPDAGLPTEPLLGRRSGWELNAAGADDGACRIGGVERSVETGELLRLAAAGDTAVLRYGELFFCAHVERRAPALPVRGLVDPVLATAAAFAGVVGLGGLAFVFLVTARPAVAKPTALQRPDELARTYHVRVDERSEGEVQSRSGRELDEAPEPAPADTPVAAALYGSSSNARSDDLSPHAFGGVVLSHYAAIESCAQPAPNTTARPPQTVRVELTTAPSGVVQAVRFLGTELGDDVVQCVGDQLRRFQFPAVSAQTTTRLTIRFGS